MGSTRDGDRERAEAANRIYAQRTPLQMSHEASSILDFVRPVVGLIVIKLDLGRDARGVLNLAHELEEKGASLLLVCRWAAWSDCAWHGCRDGAWLHS